MITNIQLFKGVIVLLVFDLILMIVVFGLAGIFELITGSII